MLTLLARALLTLTVVGLFGSVLVFASVNVIGGDAATVVLGKSATPDALASVRSDLGMDRPLVVQYLDWLAGFVHGDMGETYIGEYDIGALVSSRLGPTLALSIGATIVSLLVSVAAGTYAALHAGRARAAALDLGAQAGLSVPHFWVGLLLIAYISLDLGWLPTGGYVPWQEDPIESIRTMILPCLTLALPSAAVFYRFFRSSMLDVLNEDYIRAARARGMTLTQAALRHGVRNSSIPLVTVATLQLGALIGGSVIVEKVFSIPGVGSLLVDAVGDRETVMVQSLSMVMLLIILGLNAIMDISYGVLDPRIRSHSVSRSAAEGL